jgi:hypothetical protein
MIARWTAIALQERALRTPTICVARMATRLASAADRPAWPWDMGIALRVNCLPKLRRLHAEATALGRSQGPM